MADDIKKLVYIVSGQSGDRPAEGILEWKDFYFIEVVELPVVQVSVWSGMSEENKKKVVEGITSVLAELGIPREAITVIICEAPKNNWATAGQLHSEKYADR